MTDKAAEFSEGLSGGQKRKLSVGIALIGDPRILCLGTYGNTVEAMVEADYTLRKTTVPAERI